MPRHGGNSRKTAKRRKRTPETEPAESRSSVSARELEEMARRLVLEGRASPLILGPIRGPMS
jgi:hypothetical protein